VPIALSVAALTVIAFATSTRGRWHALWIGPVSGAALYLQICALMYLFLYRSADPDRGGWFAFVSGPALLLVASAITISLFIGFCGRQTAEWMREWWTRFGSWIAMFGAVFVVIGGVSVFGPLLILGSHWTTDWKPITTAATWVGTVIGGLLSGKSSKTNGQNNSRGLELLAKAGGVAFIAGAAILLATIVRLVLVNLADSGDPATWYALSGIGLTWLAAALGATVVYGLLFSWAFEINIFGLSHFYRNRLARCYLGAARRAPGLRHPHPFTEFDESDDIELSSLRNSFRGPFPIVNCSLNLGGSADLSVNTRHGASFSLTPLGCGADRPFVGYAPTDKKGQCFAGGVRLGQAVAVSGAAVSPNMGYSTSPVVAFLLTMFNVRLGWWFPNPGRDKWTSRRLRSSLWYLLAELLGSADETSSFVNVSDGRHFENLGIYELVRRRAKVIVAVDGECDEKLQFGSLGNLVRICDTDFGAKIDLDVSSIRLQENGLSQAHGAIGKIRYSTGSTGWLIYLKATMTGDEDVGVAQYKSTHPTFPHESTADQFFSEDQFESYRRLGLHVVQHLLRSTQPGTSPVDIAEKLWDDGAPRRFSTESFLKHTEALNGIWDRFRDCAPLHRFFNELMGGATGGSKTPSAEEVTIGLEMLQLMENVFLDLRLDDYWEHPDNRGWAALFTRWSKSSVFRAIWAQTKRGFGIRFEYFCRQRLGLPSDNPIFRVS
jgi:hypothetical protein